MIFNILTFLSTYVFLKWNTLFLYSSHPVKTSKQESDNPIHHKINAACEALNVETFV